MVETDKKRDLLERVWVKQKCLSKITVISVPAKEVASILLGRQEYLVRRTQPFAFLPRIARAMHKIDQLEASTRKICAELPENADSTGVSEYSTFAVGIGWRR